MPDANSIIVDANSVIAATDTSRHALGMVLYVILGGLIVVLAVFFAAKGIRALVEGWWAFGIIFGVIFLLGWALIFPAGKAAMVAGGVVLVWAVLAGAHE